MSAARPAAAIRATVDGDPGRPCRVLTVDPDLAEGLSSRQRAIATRLLTAPVLHALGPQWEPPEYDPHTTYGLLVIEGLLGRRVAVGDGIATELLGPGDIERPWDEPMSSGLIPPELGWRVYRPALLAVLDERGTALIGRSPQLIMNFSARLLRRGRSVSYLAAVSHQKGVEDKLVATLWHLASTWGQVCPEGVSVPYRLTHQALSEMIGAQRPSVTLALQSLQRQGRVTRLRDGGFLLRNAAPSPAAGS